MRRILHILSLSLLTSLSVSLVACGPAAERDSTPPPETTPTAQDAGMDPVERGRATYESFCASCHGLSGRGDGPVAEALAEPLSDLTQLRRENDGVFPEERVYAAVDGREDVLGHGTREMPVWGNVWSERNGEPVLEDVVQQRINEVVEYIRTLQEVDRGDVDMEESA